MKDNLETLIENSQIMLILRVCEFCNFNKLDYLNHIALRIKKVCEFCNFNKLDYTANVETSSFVVCEFCNFNKLDYWEKSKRDIWVSLRVLQF